MQKQPDYAKCVKTFRELKNCCQISIEWDRGLPQECKQYAEDVQKAEGMERMEVFIKLNDCLVKSHGFVNAAGHIGKEIFEEIVLSIFGENPDFKETLTNAAEKCLETIRKYS